MQTFLRRLALGSTFFAVAGVAQASVVIDFEAAGLANLYFPGDSFSQSGFAFTQFDDFGTVGTNADFVSGAPTGNATQYYFNSNDGALAITSTDGKPFSLDGFSAAFVPQSPASTQTIVIVAAGVPADGSAAFGVYFGLGSPTNGRYPFLSFSGAADFGEFRNLSEVDFFGCVLTTSSVCTVASHDNAQFALDDVRLTASTAPVPEPTTAALMALGLLGLGARRLRRPTASR